MTLIFLITFENMKVPIYWYFRREILKMFFKLRPVSQIVDKDYPAYKLRNTL